MHSSYLVGGEIDTSHLRRSLRTWLLGREALSAHVGTFLLVALAAILAAIYRSPADIALPVLLVPWAVLVAAHAALIGGRAAVHAARAEGPMDIVAVPSARPAAAASAGAPMAQPTREAVEAWRPAPTLAPVPASTRAGSESAGSDGVPAQPTGAVGADGSRFRPAATTLAEVRPVAKDKAASPRWRQVGSSLKNLPDASAYLPASVRRVLPFPANGGPTPEVAMPAAPAVAAVPDGSAPAGQPGPKPGPTMPLLVGPDSGQDAATDDGQGGNSRGGNGRGVVWPRRAPQAPPRPAPPTADGSSTSPAAISPPTPQARATSLPPKTEWTWLEAAAASRLARMDDEGEGGSRSDLAPGAGRDGAPAAKPTNGTPAANGTQPTVGETAVSPTVGDDGASPG